MWLVFVCSCRCLHSIRLGLCSLGSVMLHLLTAGLTVPADTCGSVTSVTPMPLAKVTWKEPSVLTRYVLCACSATGVVNVWKQHSTNTSSCKRVVNPAKVLLVLCKQRRFWFSLHLRACTQSQITHVFEGWYYSQCSVRNIRRKNVSTCACFLFLLDGARCFTTLHNILTGSAAMN